MSKSPNIKFKAKPRTSSFSNTQRNDLNNSGGAGALDLNPNTPACIVAVAEGRREQCGLACIDLNDPLKIILCRTSEASKTWSDTVNTVFSWSPSVILVPLSCAGSELASRLEATFKPHATTIRYLAKRSFREDLGISILDRLSLNQDSSIAVAKAALSFRSDYLLTMAISALVTFCESTEGMFLADGCIKFEQRATSGRLLMDCATIENLELVTNRRSGKQKKSLFGILSPGCNTGCGIRLLRSTIMSPPTDITTISARYDSVSLIRRHPELALKLRQQLKSVSVEPMIRMLAFVPQSLNQNICRRTIHGILKCAELLRLMPFIADTVEKLANAANFEKQDDNQHLWDDSSVECFIASVSNLRNPAFKRILSIVNSRLDHSTIENLYKCGWERVMQEIFAVSPGVSGALDISRKTVLLCIQEIESLFQNYVEKWNIEGMKLSWNQRVGHHIRVSTQNSNLPKALEIFRKMKKWVFGTTPALSKVVKRTNEAIEEAYRCTYDELRSILDSIRKSIPVISTIADTIAWLDMLSSFADISTKNEGYNRPTLRHGNGTGALAIKNGRHPILERLSSTNFVHNDVLLDQATSSFQIVLGPNSSGKSTYLRQVALICILGQCGCFVPAQRCQLLVVDRIFTRLSTEDDTQGNLSTFGLECSEAAYIMSNMTHNSLILFDEFGRSTSTREALGLSFAVAEYFLHTKALTLFATHFSELINLGDMYSNVKISYLDFTIDEECHVRKYTHELRYGRPPNIGTDYGIQHAALCGWGSSVIEEASKLRLRMLQEKTTEPENAALQKTSLFAKGVNTTIKRILVLGDHKRAEHFRQDLRSLMCYVQAAIKSLPEEKEVLSYLKLDNISQDDVNLSPLMKSQVHDGSEQTETSVSNFKRQPEKRLRIKNFEPRLLQSCNDATRDSKKANIPSHAEENATNLLLLSDSDEYETSSGDADIESASRPTNFYSK